MLEDVRSLRWGDPDAGVAMLRVSGCGPLRAGGVATASTTSPRSVNSMALSSKLTRICRSRSGSPVKVTGRALPVSTPRALDQLGLATLLLREARVEQDLGHCETPVHRLRIS
jgi:hypothetical protein